MDVNHESDSDCPPCKKRNYTSEKSLLYLFIKYIASQEEGKYTPEEIIECIETIKCKRSSNLTFFQSIVKRRLNCLLPILLASNDNVNFVDNARQTILHIYVMYYTDKSIFSKSDSSKDREIVKTLMERGASVDSVDWAQNTPVHYAAINQRLDLVQVMLEKFTNVNALNSSGSTVLHLLINNYKTTPNDFAIEVIRALIAKGADFRIAKDGIHRSSAILAMRYGLFKLLRSIMFKETQILKDGWLLFVSHLSANWSNHPEELQYLGRLTDLSKGVAYRDEKFHSTPLHFVSKNGRVDAVEMFVNAGADVDAAAIDDVTPLHLAVTKGHLEVVKFLIERGANVQARDKIYDFGLMHMAILGGNKAIINLLVEHGLNVEDENRDGFTPLHLAVVRDDEWMVKHLISHGADVNCRTRREQWTPLHLVVDGQTDIHELMNVGEKKEIKSLIGECLTVCDRPYDKKFQLFMALLLRKANINARDWKFRTPLHYAAKRNSEDENQRILLTLLRLGARIDVHDNKGNSPLNKIVLGYDLNSAHEVLLRYGADINDVKSFNTVGNFHGLGLYIELVRAIDLPIEEFHHNSITANEQNLNLFPIIQDVFQPAIEQIRNGQRDEEILRLKSHCLTDGETLLYEFLRMNSKRRYNFAREVLSLDLEKEYPLYHIIIENSCRRAINKKLIISLASSALTQLIQFDLPEICKEIIFNFMSLPEMTRFIDTMEILDL